MAARSQPASKRAKVDKPTRQPKKVMLVQASMPAMFQRDSAKHQVSMVLHQPPVAPGQVLLCRVCCTPGFALKSYRVGTLSTAQEQHIGFAASNRSTR